VATIAAPYDPAHLARVIEPGRPEIEDRGATRVEIAGRTVTIGKKLLDDLEAHDMEAAIRDLEAALSVFHSPADKTVPIDNASDCSRSPTAVPSTARCTVTFVSTPPSATPPQTATTLATMSIFPRLPSGTELSRIEPVVSGQRLKAHRPHRTNPEVCMSESGLKKIGVIGIGTMGNGIAQVAAQSEFDTLVMDVSSEVLERGMTHISRSLDRLVKAYEKSEGKKGITADQKAEAVARLSTTSELADLMDCDAIIEAAPEIPELKESINRQLAELGYDRILATNTSGISITRLGAAYGRPELYMGMHFMNPVPMQKGVEIIRGLRTSEETYETIVSLCRDLGKTEIPAEDKAGFAVNRAFVPFVNEAIRVVEEGIASVEDMDKCTLCLGHKMGPLMTADFVGLDVMVFIAQVLEDELGSFYKPTALLKRLVESGQLGAKTGRGFYVWEGYKPVGVNPDVARYRIK